MKLSETQAIMLPDIAKWSVNVPGIVGGYTEDQRLALVNQIQTQQSTELIELDK